MQETSSLRNFEVDLRCKTGEVHHVILSGECLEIGSEQCLITIIHDITDRKKAEDKIRLFSDAINSAFECFMVTDIKGNVTYVNEASCKTFGYTPEEFLKLNTAKLDADPKVTKRVAQEVAAKGIWSGEVLNIRKNGEKFPSFLSAFIIKDEKGNPKGTMGILRNITERKQAEHREKEYISRLQYLFESATEFVKLTPVQDIYTLIAKKIYELNKGCIVAVNIFDEVSDSLCVRALVGLGKYTEAVSKIMGTNPVGRCFPLDDAAREGLGRGKLLKIPGGIYDLSPGISKVVCQAIAKLLGLGDVYAMGLNSEGRLYGSVTLLTRSNTGLKNQDLIEAFMNQSVVAICRREAIDALRDSEANLARAQQISHSGNWDWDVKNKKLAWSEEVYRIFGVQKDLELTFEGIEAMVHPDDREKNKEFVNELLNTVDSADIEFRIIRPDGAVRYVYQNAEIRHDEAGNACRIFGIIQDITERNEVVKALEESEHRFKMLFECAPDAIYLTDMNGNFVDGNKVAEKLIGYKREELIGSNFAKSGLLSPKLIPKALAGLEMRFWP